MNFGEIREIVATYEKYEWVLKEFILTKETLPELADSLGQAYPRAGIRTSIVSAAWFSRPSKDDREAWELRLLSENPLALFETFRSGEDAKTKRDARDKLETRLAEMAS